MATEHNLRNADFVPDFRHPKIQALLGENARLRYELSLVEQILKEGADADFTAGDFEYLTNLHYRLLEVMRELQMLRGRVA